MSMLLQGFQSLVENSPDAISLLDKQGQILYSSSANTKLLGYRPDELMGLDCIGLIHPEDRDHSSSLFQQVVSEPPSRRFWDARVRHKDGSYRWMESIASNLIDDLGVQAIVMHQRDIHDRIEAREKSRLQAEELIHANQRMEEFAYTVAHDLREPLRAISLSTQMLLKNVPMDREASEMAEFIIEGTKRMSRMVSDLLSFASSGVLQPPSLFSLENAVNQALKNLSLEIQESRALVAVESLPTICSDETHFVRVFQNLISNAVKYRSVKPPEISISTEQLGQDWIIKVKDNGLGIAPEYQSRIFMPFVRLGSRAASGTGLGLAVCKKIIEGLGGTIWIDSEPGIGSTFCFTVISNLEISASPHLQQHERV